MATNAIVYSSAYETLTIQDYTGTPNSISVNLVVGSLQFPAVDAIEKTVLMINSSSGKSRHATPKHGKAGGMTFSFQFYVSDASNDTDKNVLSLLRALQISSVSGTGHSGEDYSSQLSGGGSLQAKFVVASPNQAGTAATTTYPCIVQSLEPVDVEGVRAMTVNCELVGSITRA